MKCFFIIVLVVVCTDVGYGQLLLGGSQVVNDYKAFFDESYDKALMKRNRVTKLKISRPFPNYLMQEFFFDQSGALRKVLYFNETKKPVEEFRFEVNSYGDRISFERINFVTRTSYKYSTFKFYENSRLVKDSMSSSSDAETFYDNKGNKIKSTPLVNDSIRTAFVNRFYYDDKGNKIRWITDAIGNRKSITTYTVGSSGQIKRIIEVRYEGKNDTTGVVQSDRRLLYNTKGQLEAEEEAIEWSDGKKMHHIINPGSIFYVYDRSGNLIEIVRTKGLQEKFKYNKKGLLKEVYHQGFLPTGQKYTLSGKYSYTYRK